MSDEYREGLYRYLKIEREDMFDRDEIEPTVEEKMKRLLDANIGSKEEYEADVTAIHYDYEVNTL